MSDFIELTGACGQVVYLKRDSIISVTKKRLYGELRTYIITTGKNYFVYGSVDEVLKKLEGSL